MEGLKKHSIWDATKNIRRVKECNKIVESRVFHRRRNMSYGERQQEEIKTIKERTITLQLSDHDCERIAREAGVVGLTVGELLENFIGDLTDGTYSNGSDERMYAELWFKRCMFSMFPSQTLLRHLLKNDHSVKYFLEAYREYQNYKVHPEEYVNDIEELCENEELWFIEETRTYLDEWKPEEDTDMEKELELCEKWVGEKEALMNGVPPEEPSKKRSRKPIL